MTMLFICVMVNFPCPSFATEEFARQTGKPCSACHLDPAGGGELTAAGKEYAASLGGKGATGAPEAGSGTQAPAQEKSGAVAKKLFHLIVGYLHLLTAILWFGTILYVHLVLKPQYAAGGLPKGEVRVGVLSMIVIAVTGVILTAFRIQSPDMLLHTRFGILLLVKVSLYLVMVLSGLFVVLTIGPRLKAQRKGGGEASETGIFTLAHLAHYDGKEGRPAYFAYRDKVYDASASRMWKAGVHMGRHHAGEDLTEVLKLAPHGPEQVTALPTVGDLVAAEGGNVPLHERVFYILAYMNLTIVFFIVFIVALWRWS